MSLRAEQWLMLGVVGLGAAAIYFLSRTDRRQPTTDSRQPTADRNGAPRVDPNLPDAAGPVTPPAGVVFVTGDPNRPSPTMNLVNGLAYRGRGENLSERDLGFLDAVRVYDNPAEARTAGFPEWILAGASKSTRWFYGSYFYPDQAYQRPPPIAMMLDDRWFRAPSRTAGLPGYLPHTSFRPALARRVRPLY